MPDKQVTWKGICALLGLALVLVGLAAIRIAAGHRPREDTLERVRREGVVRIGYANEAPYGYLDTETGEITGEAPEIARVILERMGIEHVEPVVTEFGSLIPALKARRFDLIAAGMYVTPQRCREVAFSDPTYVIGESFIVRRGNPLDLHSFEDVAAHHTARLGFVGGTVEHRYARAVGIPAERIVLFPDNISALTAVRTGRIDAAAATRLTVHDLLEKADTDELERAVPFRNPKIEGETALGYGAFAFRLEDQAFVKAFNAQLDEFIGTEEHLNLTRRFGIRQDTLPGDVTAQELCQSD